MTARTALAAASLVLAATATGCVTFYEIAVETPINAKLDVSPFQRVLVAGFVAGGTKNIDANTETARLIRSQLRTKADMKVIDADMVPLIEEVDKRRQTPPPANEDEVRIKNEKDLQDYEQIFADVDYWKKLGEEYQSPLIVTGSILFTEVTKSGVVPRLQQVTDPSTGRTSYQEVRQYSNLHGYALTPKFIFIDGRTGAQLYSESFHEEALYPDNQTTPALSSYFELMDKLLPGFLNTLSTQKIKGTRYLLK
jgi:hypothetical protein